MRHLTGLQRRYAISGKILETRTKSRKTKKNTNIVHAIYKFIKNATKHEFSSPNLGCLLQCTLRSTSCTKNGYLFKTSPSLSRKSLHALLCHALVLSRTLPSSPHENVLLHSPFHKY